jgi:uncharacterized protein with HEPN domain
MRDDLLFLNHIMDAIHKIELYITDVSHDDFVRNGFLQDAVMRRLEIIGEAARNLSPGLQSAHPQIEWGQIIGLRNRLIHGYFDVDTELVWEIIKTDIPTLKSEVDIILHR